jgi:hypothetical protein
MITRGFSFPMGVSTNVTQIIVPHKVLIGISITGYVIAALASSKAYIIIQSRSDYSAGKFDATVYGQLQVGAAAGGANSAAVYIPIPGGVTLDGEITVQGSCSGAGADSDFQVILQFLD